MGILITVLMIGIIVALVLVFNTSEDEDNDNYRSALGRGAIATPGIECADIGKDIFAKNGSVADVTIAVLLCSGVTTPQSHGLGGGFVATIYTKKTGKVEILNARETAPMAATFDMFVNDTEKSTFGM